VRFSRLAILILIGCMAIQGYIALVADCRSMSQSRSSPQGPFPSDNSGLPVPLEEYEIEWKFSDCDDEAFCPVALPSGSNPCLVIELCDRNLSGFHSCREMLNTLHHLRI